MDSTLLDSNMTEATSPTAIAYNLPAGWTEHQDKEGKTFYFNAKTNESRWDKPPMLTTRAQQALDNSPWKEHEDEESGKKYYYNADTGETTWEMPEEYKILFDRVNAQIKSNLLNQGTQMIDAQVLEFKTREDAEEAFMEMLQEFQVDDTWAWEQVIRKCHMHRMYKALKTITERRDAFDRYMREKKQEMEKNRSEKYDQDRKILRKLFVSHAKEITGSTKFASAMKLLAAAATPSSSANYIVMEDAGAVEPTTDNSAVSDFEKTTPATRRKIFEEYIDELRQKEKESARELRKVQLVKFKDLLKTLGAKSEGERKGAADTNISPSTTWKEAQALFLPIISQDKNLKDMDMMDALIWFDDYVSTLDSSIRQERQARIRAIRRKERKDRELFIELLSELREAKTLHINSKWKDIYLVFKDDERYINILGSAGSSAMELFRDQIMEMEARYMPDRRIIMDTTRADDEFEVTLHTTFSEFMSHFKREFRGIPIDHAKFAFEELLHKAEKREREEKRYQERKLRKKMDAFKSVLKHLSPSIKLADTWLSIRDRAKEHPEFGAIGEDERVEVFGKFMKRLHEKQEGGGSGAGEKRKRNRSPSGGEKAKRAKPVEDTDDDSEEGSKSGSKTKLKKDGSKKSTPNLDESANGGALNPEDLKKLQDELALERSERNYFQIERDKINNYWEITRNELSSVKSALLNRDRELEELEERHQVEIKVYKQKVKHLLYEYQNNVAHLQADSERALQVERDDGTVKESQLKKDKRALKLELKEFELSHEDIIKNLKQKHDQEITLMRADFERQAKELHQKYDKKMRVIREELELKRKNEIHEIEERKNGQINALMKNHDKAFTEIKNYYNDITLNNLALINSLKEQVEEMKKKEERNEKQMADITAENKRLSEPLQVALAEGDALKRELAHYEKDKLSLQNAKARLKVLEEKYKQSTWEQEVLEQRFAQVQKERDELYEQFVDRIISVQQKTGFKNLILEKKVESLKENLEKRELQVNEILKATNLDPAALASLTKRLEDVLNAKNDQIKDLQYDLAKVTKAHNDMIRVYEAKLTEYSIPVEELGFKPMILATKTASNPAGFVAAQ